MHDDIKYYEFWYDGQQVCAGSVIEFFGEFFYPNGERAYGGVWSPCVFKYVQNDIYYIEIHGQLCTCKDFKKKINRFKTLNGKPVANPVTEDDVKSGTILLVLIMTVTTIFKGSIVLWILELIIYFGWRKKKKYS